jgi:hypothetical protein
VAEFLLELYVPRDGRATVDADVDRAGRAASELAREGTPVRYVRSIYVPEDETCFLLYEADSADGVREAARRAGLPFDRVVEAVAESAVDA